MLNNYNRTLPSRDKLKRLTDYSKAIQKHVKTLTIHNKIAFYIILEKNGQVHQLHAGDIESSTRNTATGNNKDSISAGIQSVGLNVSDDTMRSYLNEAKEIFPNVKPTKS